MPVRDGEVIEVVRVGVHPAGGDLVQQRLPDVRRVAVDQRHLHAPVAAVAVAQLGRERQAARASADDDNAMLRAVAVTMGAPVRASYGQPVSGAKELPNTFHVDCSDMHGVVSIIRRPAVAAGGGASSASANRCSSGLAFGRLPSGSRPSTTMDSTYCG